MRVVNVCFSPTGGTRAVSEALTGSLSEHFFCVDLAQAGKDFETVAFASDDVAVISAPCYNGRVPTVAVERIRALHAYGAAAVVVCVYGNRAYDDALLELFDTALAAGFRVVGAVAAVAEHSLVGQFARGRPDEIDLGELAVFAKQIRTKLASDDWSLPVVPGNRPYRRGFPVKIVPRPRRGCTRCGTCVQACPVGAIDAREPSVVDKKKCFSCMRCASVCPHALRKISPVMRFVLTLGLKPICSERRSNAFFL